VKGGGGGWFGCGGGGDGLWFAQGGVGRPFRGARFYHCCTVCSFPRRRAGGDGRAAAGRWRQAERRRGLQSSPTPSSVTLPISPSIFQIYSYGGEQLVCLDHYASEARGEKRIRSAAKKKQRTLLCAPHPPTAQRRGWSPHSATKASRAAAINIAWDVRRGRRGRRESGGGRNARAAARPSSFFSAPSLSLSLSLCAPRVRPSSARAWPIAVINAQPLDRSTWGGCSVRRRTTGRRAAKDAFVPAAAVARRRSPSLAVAGRRVSLSRR